MKADNQRAVEAGIAAWLKRGLCTPALLPRVTGITIQQIPNFWLLRRAFIDPLDCKMTLKRDCSTTETAIPTWLCREPQLQVPNPNSLVPFPAEGHPITQNPCAASQGWLLMPGQGYQCLAFPALLFPTPFPHRYFYKV